jgi:septum site-determining protein MinC
VKPEAFCKLDCLFMINVPVAFDLKSSQIDVFSLQVHDIPSENNLRSLIEKLERLPFHETAHMLLLDVSKIKPQITPDLSLILNVFSQKNILCVGLIHSDEVYGTHLAKKYDLSYIHSDMVRNHAVHAKIPPSHRSEPIVLPVRPVYRTITIDKPVRAGQQIYAEHADLVVLSTVSTGAELIADGHIHIYGTLRGRALAGASGNTQARIFVQSMQAELVSIAGMYRVIDEPLAPSLYRQPVQIFLAEQRIVMKNLNEMFAL